MSCSGTGSERLSACARVCACVCDTHTHNNTFCIKTNPYTNALITKKTERETEKDEKRERETDWGVQGKEGTYIQVQQRWLLAHDLPLILKREYIIS